MSEGQVSLHVLFNGKKKAFSLTPNTILQTTLAEAAIHFKLDVNRCKFKQRSGAFVDCSQSFRFSTLSKNAQLELVQTAAATASSTATCRLALSIIPTSTNITMAVSATLSLNGLLSSLVNEGKVPANLFVLFPEIVYLRSTYTGEAQLNATTFQSLGLENQSVRMQLRYSSISAANPIAPSALESQSQIATNPSEQPDTLIAALVSSEGGNLPPSSVPTSEPSEGSPQSPVPQVTEKAKSAPEAEKASVTIEPCKPKTVAGEQIPTPSLQLNEEGVSATKTTAKRAFADPRQCIASMLSQNLDAVTLPAVLTLYKYIQNILGDPAAMKFRTINTTNKNFIAKVASSKGSQEFLQSAGFQSSDSHPTMIVYTPPCVVSAGNRSDNGHTATVEELEALFQAQEALLFALQELNTDPEAAPITKEIVLQRLQQQASASSSRPVISFDPFKASVVRTAPQPVRMESATEKQLQELQLKRRELEGDPQSVQRSTVVSFPSQQPSGQQPMEHSDATYVQQAAGSGTIPGGMLKKIMQSGKEEDSPLTTKAVRDLQRLQKERVYSRTLIKVRFPDRVTVQGYFHPRHSMQDVCEWLQECFTAGGARKFELYTSPPRTVVAVSHPEHDFKSGLKSKLVNVKVKGEEDNEVKTLCDHGFVPAVLLHLAWTKDDSVREKPSPGGDMGSYLKEELLTAAAAAAAADISNSSKDAMSSSSSLRPDYPVGERLVRQEAADIAQPKGSNIKASDGSSSSSSSSFSSSSSEQIDKKPKWFKI